MLLTLGMRSAVVRAWPSGRTTVFSSFLVSSLLWIGLRSTFTWTDPVRFLATQASPLRFLDGGFNASLGFPGEGPTTPG